MADGFDIQNNLGLSISDVEMVFGRVVRHVFVAHLLTSDFDQTSIDYAIEKSVVLGRFIQS